MGKNDFKRNDCVRALRKIGFYLSPKSCRRHDKYIHKQTGKFIMIPRHNQFHCQNAILKELRNIDENLLNQFLELI
ncbi:MAG: hypothetical protein UV40_C0024G0015 [Parcubacteria group bacterium GW2011_GWA1_42_7]|nr:MAG: hypothetical protein UV40_C0024G0015 [Parcubacteria group bacterium GW2011_GWA1_42_7]KKS91992.1 MAG: hypothetical protein UV67_C0013G0017 [Parcubacteria group bacterium GW2011_GWC1_43_12]